MAQPVESTSAATFVTVLGWVLVVLSGCSLVTSIMQNVMVSFVLPAMEQDVAQTQQEWSGVMFAVRLLAGFMLCVAAFLLFAAWSFLKRRDWARKTFVALFALSAIVGGLVFLVLGLGMGVFDLLPTPHSGQTPPTLGSLFRVMAVMIGLVAAVFAALFLWLIKRLRSADVRAEFQVRPT